MLAEAAFMRSIFRVAADGDTVAPWSLCFINNTKRWLILFFTLLSIPTVKFWSHEISHLHSCQHKRCSTAHPWTAESCRWVERLRKRFVTNRTLCWAEPAATIELEFVAFEHVEAKWDCHFERLLTSSTYLDIRVKDSLINFVGIGDCFTGRFMIGAVRVERVK